MIHTLTKEHRRTMPHRHGKVRGVEIVEPRMLLSVAPLVVGAVYIEEDLGNDIHGDTFELTFNGGAPGTQLTRAYFDGNQNGPEFAVGDVFFDTESTPRDANNNGYGADQSFAIQKVSDRGIDSFTAKSIDGTTLIEFEFAGFEAGEKFVFSVDVDEVEEFDPDEESIDVINEGFDPITSGVEFQGSHLTTQFTAVHYSDIESIAEFRNRYDDQLVGTALNLPLDDERGNRDRTAGAVDSVQQQFMPAKISGHVYHDENQNGVRDNGEEGIPGVRLEVIPVETIDIQQTVSVTTDHNGFYQVENLVPGNYRIVESQPEGYLDGLDAVGTVDGRPVGRAINPGDTIDEIFLPGGSEGVDYDFGEVLAASLEGRIHLANENGDCFGEEAFHEPLAGAVVELYDAEGNLVERTTSADDGTYKFSNLRPGQYSIVEITPDELFDGGSRSGIIDGQLSGQVGDSRTTSIELGSGDIGTKFDFCEIEPVSISGNVHLSTPDGDCFGDDTSHRPLAGVRVQLFSESGTLVAETITDEQGNYVFLDLLPGTYSIVEITPDGLIDGGAQSGHISELSLGIVLNPNEIDQISLGPGQQAVDFDFCEHEPSSISGFVYHDQDNDGVFDVGESPIGFVEVLLLDAEKLPLDIAITSSDGSYEFTGLEAGNYSLGEIQPVGWLDGLDTAGTINGRVVGTADSDADEITDIKLRWGEYGIMYNFGEIRPGSIAGNVHLGSPDGDCFSSSSDYRPLVDSVVQLLDANGVVIHEELTDSNGDYAFLDVVPGEYAVRQITPSGLLEGGAHLGTIDTLLVGEVDGPNLITQIEISSDQAAINYDFCDFEPATISGFVYYDQSNDGIRSPDEDPIAGVIVVLYDENNQIVEQAVTDENGAYRFANLPAGEYSIREFQPEDFLDGLDAAGTVSGRTNGTAKNPGDEIQQIKLQYGDVGIDYNFGEILLAGLAGYVHTDVEIANCQFDVARGDEYLEGVVIELLNANGDVVATTTTDQNGRFEFIDLQPGTYSVREIQPEGYFDGRNRADDQLNSVTPNLIESIDLQPGDFLDYFVFCEDPPSEVSGYVFQDGGVIQLAIGETTIPPIEEVRDGRFTSDDTSLAGVELELRVGPAASPFSPVYALDGHYPDGTARVRTDANGFYKFTGLRSGTYAVYEVQPSGYIDGIDSGGTVAEVVGLNLAPPFAINQSNPIGELMLQALEDAPGFDVITRISLPAGTKSTDNNFSEVVVSQQILPPLQIPEFEPPVGTPSGIQSELIVDRLPIPLDLVEYNPKSIRRYIGKGTTWHLSVVDGGTPRGDGDEVRAEGPTWLKAPDEYVVSWDVDDMQSHEWVFLVDGAKREKHFGVRNGIPIVGDFNGDGVSEMGFFFEGNWFIDINGNGRWDNGDLWAKLGHRGDQPVTGDWDGDGKDDIGVFGAAWPGDPRAIQIEPGLPDRENLSSQENKDMPPEPEDATHGKRTLQLAEDGRARSDVIDHVFHFGGVGDHAVTGDWNGDGVTTIGIFVRGMWRLDDNGDGRFSDVDKKAEFGRDGDIPVVGDFNGDGIDEIGIYRNGQFILDMNGNRKHDAADLVINSETQGRPIVGDFDGDGTETVGIVRSIEKEGIEIQARK